MQRIRNYLAKAIWYSLLAYFTYLMVLITLQYVPIRFDVAFLNIKREAIALKHYQWAFFSHVYTSIFVLIAGITQFSTTIRSQYPLVHRNMGKLYVGLVLLIASPSGLVMALYANGGIYSKISFIIQAVLWFGFTYKAYSYVQNKDWLKHHHFMMRSYALTLSAISLRVFKWIIANTLELPPMDTYKIVAWLGWMVNLVIVEIWIYYKRE